MYILLCLTVLGSIATLLLIGFKPLLLKKYGGNWYYYIWILVLISFCFPFKVDIAPYFETIASIKNSELIVMEGFAPLILGEEVQLFPQATIIPDIQVIPAVSLEIMVYGIYFLGMIVCIVYYSVMYFIFMKRIKDTTKPVENTEYIHCLMETSSYMGVTKKIGFKESPLVGSPMYIGITKPMIILPVQKFNVMELGLILKHELTHYKRRDMLYRFIAVMVHCVHWFNPISYLALHNINEACEYACDEAVTNCMDKESKQAYGYMLLNQIKSSTKESLFLFGFSQKEKKKNIIKRRLHIIMNGKKYKTIPITCVSIMALVLGANFFDLYPVNQEGVPIEEYTQEDLEKSTTIDPETTIKGYFDKTTSQEDIQMIYTMADNANHNGGVGNRSLRDSEEDRLDGLREEFINEGMRPKVPLSLIVEGEGLYLDTSNETYHYPQRDVTDEELLQLIEWRFRVNYALSLRNPPQEEAVPSGEMMSEEEAIAVARDKVKKVFDEDITDFKVDAGFQHHDSGVGVVRKPAWFIEFEKDEINPLNWNRYVVFLNYETNSEEVICMSNDIDSYMTMNKMQEEIVANDPSWAERAVEIVVEKYGETGTIKEVYQKDTPTEFSEGYEPHTVNFRINMEDESFYSVSMYYPNKELRKIGYTP